MFGIDTARNEPRTFVAIIVVGVIAVGARHRCGRRVARHRDHRQPRGTTMNDQELLGFVTDVWDRDIVPTLQDYIRIPNVSPVFEEDWESLGHMERAVALLADWCRVRPIPGLTLEVHGSPGSRR